MRPQVLCPLRGVVQGSVVTTDPFQLDGHELRRDVEQNLLIVDDIDNISLWPVGLQKLRATLHDAAIARTALPLDTRFVVCL